MSRKNRTPEENARREKIRELLQLANIGSMDDIQNLFKETIAEFMENGLEAELDDELGYGKYDYRNKETDNSRNGHSSKTLKTSFGEVEVSVPRDRKGEFEPQLLKKHQTSISQDIEEKILSMYAKGMTTSDIEAHIHDLFLGDVPMFPLCFPFNPCKASLCRFPPILFLNHFKFNMLINVLEQSLSIACSNQTDQLRMQSQYLFAIAVAKHLNYVLGSHQVHGIMIIATYHKIGIRLNQRSVEFIVKLRQLAEIRHLHSIMNLLQFVQGFVLTIFIPCATKSSEILNCADAVHIVQKLAVGHFVQNEPAAGQDVNISILHHAVQRAA